MDKYDMTSLFCNLLDNAVEAATGYPNAFIEIYADFSKSHNLLLLSVKNSCMQKPSINTKGRLKTQKFPNGIHGTGLKSGLCQDFFAKVKFCRLVAGSQPAMISDARSSSALKR